MVGGVRIWFSSLVLVVRCCGKKCVNIRFLMKSLRFVKVSN